MGRTRARDTEHPQTRLDHGGIARIIPSDFTSGFELIVDDTPQSHVDLDDPTHLHFEYIVRMGAVIDQLPEGPLTALHLGAGALTIPRYVAATRPGSRQQVIEWEAPLAALVKEHLPLPRDAAVRVRIGDAREGIGRLPAALQGSCDLVVSDVYSGAQTPAHLTSVEFYRELRALLAPTGVLLVNVADGPGLAFARRQVATIAEVLPEIGILADTQVLKGRRFGNLVIAASASPLPTEWLPRMLAAGPHPAKIAQGAEVSSFIQGARVVTDADAVASPRPDASLFLR
ncbi:spermidine synthase [Microbacterium hydrocarbonoxydans]|uniref:spermidine synthase n=1 Tax=Microbacterium hydrocarbonoxydans TaxID=273678 RepID=UPI002041C5F4|nr:fused MFS/spermidine synthase [Microbacterium hydrocarbonoxydans]MCM3781235.1 fused MFS/spermidine synthase [Microbacterium hydrocarbonoxydans]